MDHFIVAAKLRILVLQGVKAVWTIDDDFFHVVGLENLDSILCHALKEILVAEAPCRLPIAGLLGAEDSKVYSGFLQDLGESNSGLFTTIIKRTSTTYKVEILGFGVISDQRNIQPLRPVHSFLVGKTPGIPLSLHALESAGQFARKACLLLNEMATHVDNLVHILNQHRAGFLTGATGGAGPQGIVVDQPFTHNLLPHFFSSRPRLLVNHFLLMGIEVVPQVKEELAGSQLLLAHRRRTVGRAAATLGATVHVEHLFPGKLVNMRGAKR